MSIFECFECFHWIFLPCFHTASPKIKTQAMHNALARATSAQAKFIFFLICAIAVGGLTSPLRGPYAEPLYFAEKPPDYPPLNYCGLDYDEEQRNPARPGITAATESKKLGSHCEETEAEESKPSSPCCPQISEPNHKRSNKTSTVPELELRKLERGALFSMIVLLV